MLTFIFAPRALALLEVEKPREKRPGGFHSENSHKKWRKLKHIGRWEASSTQIIPSSHLSQKISQEKSAAVGVVVGEGHFPLAKMAPSTGGRQRHLAAPHAWKYTHPKIQQNKNIKGPSGIVLVVVFLIFGSFKE